MPGPLLTLATSMQCPHGAKATPVPSQSKVLIDKSAALVASDTGTVAGCPFTLPGPKPSPCVTVQWTAPAIKVLLAGQPALLASSVGLCKSPEQAPQGPVVASPSPKVKGM